MNSTTVRIAVPIVLLKPSENVTYPNQEAMYESLGFSNLTSSLYISLFITFAAIGFILNTVSFCVLLSAKFNYMPLYFYLKVTTLCSAVLNLIQILFALAVSRQFIHLTNSVLAQYFLAYVASPLNSILFFYKCVLDALISLDRISIFKPSVKERMTLSPSVYSILAFLVAIVLNLPHVLLYKPYNYYVYDEYEGLDDFHVTDTSPFAASELGKSLIFSFLVFRSVSICLIDIALNMISLFIFKQYLLKKKRLLNILDENHAHFMLESLSPAQSPIHEETPIVKHQHHSQHRNSSVLPTVTSHHKIIEHHEWFDAERNIAIMVIVLCSVSVIHQIFFVGNVFFTIYMGGITRSSAIFLFVTNLVSCVRYGSNFFIYFSFNKNFNEEFRLLLKGKLSDLKTIVMCQFPMTRLVYDQI
jgi:hypothetical protein